jgi:hypothetical protein
MTMQVNTASAGSMFHVAQGTSPVNVATALALVSRYPKTKITVSDTSANIARNLDNLQKMVNNVSSVTLTDIANPITLSATQLKRNGALLAKVSGNYSLNVNEVTAANAATVAAKSHVAKIWVSDTSNAIADKLTAFKDITKLQAITQKGTIKALSLTAAELSANSTVLAKISGGYTLEVSGANVTQALTYTSNDKVKSVSILDTSANVADKLDNLKELGLRIKEIRTSENTAMVVTADQVKNDALVLGKIYSNYQLAVVNANSYHINALSSNKKVVSVDIVDTGANVVKNLALYKKLGADLNSIQISDNSTPLAISSDQWALNESIVGKFQAGYSLAVSDVSATYAQAMLANSVVSSIAIKDNSQNISANLESLSGNLSKITSITQKGPPNALVMTAAQYASDGIADTLAKIQGNYSLTVNGVDVTAAKAMADANQRIVSMTINGSASDIKINLSDLNVLGQKVESIVQTDSGTDIALSLSQWQNQSSALEKVVGGYRATVSGVTVAQAMQVAADARVGTVQITDSGANLQARINDLQDLGAQVSSITQTDTAALTITADQFAANAGVLGKFGDGKPSLVVTKVSSTNAAAFVSNDKVTGVHVEDNGYNISANIGALAANEKLQSITQIGPMLPLSVTYGQVTDAAAALSKIAGGYSLSVTGVAAEDATSLADNAKVSSMSVTGTNLTIASNLINLHGLGKKVANIQQSNAGVALALTADQWQNQAATLNKVVGGFNTVVSGVSAAKAQLVAADDRVNSISVKDTGVNIENYLDTLQTLGSPLTQIEQTDNASLSLTANQWALNQGVLAKYKTGTSPTVVVNQLRAADAKSVSDDERVSLVKIIDTSENVATNISVLQDIASQTTPKLGTITLRGNDPLVMSYQKRIDSSAALAKISSNYSLSITDATAEQAASLENQNKVVSVAVVDSASNISSKLSQLHGLGNKLRKVQLSIAGAPLTLTSAQWSTRTATLNKIEGGYTATVSGVAAAKANAVLSDSHVVSLQVKDSLLNISNQLTALQALGRQVSEIEQTDVGRLTVSANDWTSNKTAIDKVKTSSLISSTQANAEFSITQASVSWLSESGADSRVKTIAIKDTSSNVSQEWENIKGSSKITGIDLTTITNALNLSAELIGNSTSTLAKINGNYLINATSANIAQAQTLLSNSHVQSIDVLDSRANVNTSFDQLNDNTKIGNIYLNNNDAPVALSQSQVLGGLTTLNKLQSSYTLDVSGVSVANVVNFAETLPIHTMSLIATSDEVSVAIDDLSAIEGKLASIEVTDGGDELIELSYQQFQENANLLAKISSAYQLAVNNVAADDALGTSLTQVNGSNTVSALSVSDTVNNVKLNLENLKTIGDALKIITVTDEEAMNLTQEEYDNYLETLNKILGTVDINVEV